MTFYKNCLIKFLTFSKFTSLHERLNSHCEAWTYKNKKKKMKTIEESCLEIIQGKNAPINSSHFDQRKAFYGQRIQESRRARKETVDIEILLTSRNGDRKIVLSIRITSESAKRRSKWKQFIQFRRASSKVIPIEKTQVDDISTMSQALIRSSMCRTNRHNLVWYHYYWWNHLFKFFRIISGFHQILKSDFYRQKAKFYWNSN